MVYFEAFRVGQVFHLPSFSLSEEDIVQYARQFDPQRIHVDREFADQGPFGGLIASGYHTLARVWAAWINAGILGDESMGGPGLDSVKWLVPVRPGDELTVTVTVTGARRSESKPRGIVSFHFQTVNQRGETVMTTDGAALLRLNPDVSSDAIW